MAIHTIVRLGHPALRTPARPVPKERIGTPAFAALIADMVATMREASGVGLAAPQIELDWQIFVYEVAEAEGGPGEARAVINPMLEPRAGELVYDWEGCLSIPGLRGLVPRHPAVVVHGLDPEGGTVEFVAEGLLARVMQHEYDHLNGVVFLDRMGDFRSLAFQEEWDRYMVPDRPDEESSAVG